MASLKDIVCYLITNYPNKSHLSNARITKMVYLADWYSANVFGKQVSTISWFFNNFGPYVEDVLNMAKDYSDFFTIKIEENYYGMTKRIIGLKDNVNYSPELSNQEKESLDKIIDISKRKSWDEFITLVYSTYPIVVSDRYSTLDLIKLAKDYQAKKKETT